MSDVLRQPGLIAGERRGRRVSAGAHDERLRRPRRERTATGVAA
jgi:hypothetical protein